MRLHLIGFVYEPHAMTTRSSWIQDIFFFVKNDICIIQIRLTQSVSRFYSFRVRFLWLIFLQDLFYVFAQLFKLLLSEF